MDRAQLFDALSHLSPQDFERLLVAVNMPRMNRAGTSATIGAQVSALLEWADSSIGPGVEAIARHLAELNHFEFDAYLRSLIATYEKWWEHYTITDAVGKVEQPQPEKPSIFDFGLMVQTVTKEREPTDPEHTPLQQDKEKTEPLPVLNGIRKYANGHVLLVGRPGSGKSTALIRLVLEVATETLTEGQGQIPILVELRYWQTSVIERIQAFLYQHAPTLSLDNAALTTLLRQGRFLLLIDGLNELPSDEARTQLNTFRRDHPQVPMIFTTRDLGLGGDLGIEKKLEMQPLTEAQMKAFIRAYVPDQAEAMLRQLSDRLREFGQTPLLLWMLCEVFQQSPNRQMPTNLAEVFRAFTTMYEDSSVRKHEVALLKGDVRPLSDRRLWKEALKALAARMMQGETQVDFRVAIHRTEAERELGKLFAKEKFPVRDILDDLLKYHLLQNRTTDQLEFRHQLIQEYYAAEHLLDLLPELSDKQLKRDYLNLLKWTEAIALMLALLDDEAQALRVVKLAIHHVDWMLGARLAGKVKPKLQAQTISEINSLELPIILKCKCWGKSRSEKAIPWLLNALEHSNSSICWEATDALGHIGGDVAIPPLLIALRNKKNEFPGKVVEALGRTGDETAIPELLNALQDPKVGWDAARALGEIGSEAAIPGLLEIFKSQNSDISSRAAISLGIIGSELAVPSLLDGLECSDTQIGRCAAKTLGEISSRYTISGLIKALSSQNSDVHPSAAEALGKIGDKQAIPALLQTLKHNDPEVCEKSAEALGRIGDKQAIPALLQTLKHNDPEVCEKSAEALGRIGDKQAIPALLQVLRYDDPQIVGVTAEALGRVGGKQVVSALLQALKSLHCEKINFETYSKRLRKSYDQGVQERTSSFKAFKKSFSTKNAFEKIISTLSKVGEEYKTEALVEVLNFDNEYCRLLAVKELGKLDDECAIAGLRIALKDDSISVYAQAVSELSEKGFGEMFPKLIELLKIGSNEVRGIAAKSLGKIKYEDAIPLLIQTLDYSEDDPENRYLLHEITLSALIRMGSGKALHMLWSHCLAGKLNRLEVINSIQNCCGYYNYENAYGIISPGKAISLYLSCAPADKALQAQLTNHLTMLEYQGIITRWSSHQILPGSDRTQTIHQQLNTADIILLLISPDAIADDTCYHLKIQRAIERHQSGEARVIPILLRPVDWQGALFSQLDVLPKNHQPVTTWPNPDQAFQEIAESIRTVAMEVRKANQ